MAARKKQPARSRKATKTPEVEVRERRCWELYNGLLRILAGLQHPQTAGEGRSHQFHLAVTVEIADRD